MDSQTMLRAAREVFAKGLWNSGGWGSGGEFDRRCILGQFRHSAGVKGSLGDKRPGSRLAEAGQGYDPWLTSYEEVVFACASIIEPTWDFTAMYEKHRARGYDENKAVLMVLDEAEGRLMGYNDAECRSTAEMLALLEEASNLVKERREARRAEFSGVQSQIDAAIAEGADVVVASADDATLAREEYEARRKLDPSLPPVYDMFFSGTGSKKNKRSRAKKRDRVRAAGKSPKVIVAGDRNTKVRVGSVLDETSAQLELSGKI